MVTTASARDATGRSAASGRPWLLPAAVVAILILGVVGAFVILGGPQPSAGAGPCTEVSSAGCRPFVDALYAELGNRGSEVAVVHGRPWCGEDTCQVLFGAEALRLSVTFYDGTTAELFVLAVGAARAYVRSGGLAGRVLSR